MMRRSPYSPYMAIGVFAGAALLGVNGCRSTVELPGASSENAAAAVDKGRPQVDLQIDLGLEYLRSGDRRLAFKHVEAAIRRAPSYAPAHMAMAVLRESLDDREAARAHYRQAVRLRPMDAGIRNNFGNFLCREQRYTAADRQFRAGLQDKLYAMPELLLSNAGLCALRKQDLGQAELYFRQALRHNAQFAPALYQMASIAFRVGRYASSERYLQRFFQQGERTLNGLWLGVRVYRQLKRPAKARELAEALRASFPDAPQIEFLN